MHPETTSSIIRRHVVPVVAAVAVAMAPRAAARQAVPSHWESPALSALRAAEALADSTAIASKGMTLAPFSMVGADGSRYELAAVFDDVPVYYRNANLAEGQVIGAWRASRDYGLSGEGIRIGVWDDGHPYEHAEFGSRLVQAQDTEAGSFSGHATHVAGTLIASGVDADARGMAPQATVTAYGRKNDYMEMFQAAAGGLRVSNHSYTLTTGWERTAAGSPVEWTYWVSRSRFGVYSGWTWYWDWVMEDHPMYLAVAAAGNHAGQGPDIDSEAHYHDGFDGALHTDSHPQDCADGTGCLGSLAASKNALVIGALTTGGDALASFSSRGPTADGRLKPDLMAVGENVYSTVGGNAYATSSGTSMATPMAAGSVALLLDQERRLYPEPWLLSSTMKALLIHTAEDLGYPGPDFDFGWGRIDAAEAVRLLAEESTSEDIRILQPIVDGSFEITVPSSGSELKATLAWIDPHVDDVTDRENPEEPALMRDFDLEVVVNGEVVLPLVPDPANPAAPARPGRDRLNNVEQIVVASSGTVTVRVTGPGGVQQPVSLVITSEARATAIDRSGDVPAPETSVDLYPNPVPRGGSFRVSASADAVELYDVTGRRVASWAGGNAPLPIPASLPAGVYLARVTLNRGIVARPLVVR